MATELWLGSALVVAFILYALFGGADFGGGVWDLLASGPRQAEQRALIARALGPVWEVNHVWLIIGVVILFGGFPRAFAALTVTLHVPLTLLLLGIVFRGTAFTFRTYDARGDQVQRRWGFVFSVASILSPALLGMCVGAVVGGELQGRAPEGVSSAWWTPFALAVGRWRCASSPSWRRCTSRPRRASPRSRRTSGGGPWARAVPCSSRRSSCSSWRARGRPASGRA